MVFVDGATRLGKQKCITILRTIRSRSNLWKGTRDKHMTRGCLERAIADKEASDSEIYFFRRDNKMFVEPGLARNFSVPG